MNFWMDESDRKQDFSGEEIAIFKRYIEENDVYDDNTFEFFEKNLDYFASRYTRAEFDCMAERFHANSDFWISDEMTENISLYEKSVQWCNETVHPKDSEYVIKEEKYLFLESSSEKFRCVQKPLPTSRRLLHLFVSCNCFIFKVDAISG